MRLHILLCVFPVEHTVCRNPWGSHEVEIRDK
jgi:hypothetical protein